MAPRERDSELRTSSSWGQEPPVSAQRTWLRRLCGSRCEDPGAREGGLHANGPLVQGHRCRGCALGGAGAARGPIPTRRVAQRPPRAAGPYPPHPAAGGQCRYEEKASIVPPANRHTPDLRYCALSIEMQTSRVRRPQSARASQRPAAPGCGRGGRLGPSSAAGSGR